ncbi:hypothetical protein [Lactobacillus xylocopicola]|uniref:Uncharacterized protein n=1 Tax=Lactobacillus xylocopicola TaxID=2976676 RepID=A0ABM8BIF4_9LACO|nr:hypothetical protein [Lactobacillus xylocopicola]BDR61083.1 hypothetical protein KIM322_13440 [Lactobacillus xylocopicola]
MKKVAKVLLTALLLAVSVAVSFPTNNVIAADAKTPKAVRYDTDKAWTRKLAKAGYVFMLPNADKGALIKANGNSYSKKTLNKIVNNFTLFKVKRIKSVHNGVFADLVSKNGKYKGSTTYVNGFYNKNLLNEKLELLINVELTVMNAKDLGKPTDGLLTQAEAIAAGLTGQNKKIALTSIRQLKDYIKWGTMAETPVLLVGRYPGNVLEEIK